jgi:hypothetical protein
MSSPSECWQLTPDTSCIVLAVLLELQTKPLNLSHFFYCRLHRRYYSQYIILGSDPPDVLCQSGL